MELPRPTTLLRGAAAACSGPARGRAASRIIIAIVAIKITCIAMNFADTLFLGIFGEPYVDTLLNYTDMSIGARAPGVAATPRQCRPPANRTRWGGVWLLWTAPLRRGVLHGVCMHLINTLNMWRNLFRGPRARGGVRTMAMAIAEESNSDSPAVNPNQVLETEPRMRKPGKEEASALTSGRPRRPLRA